MEKRMSKLIKSICNKLVQQYELSGNVNVKLNILDIGQIQIYEIKYKLCLEVNRRTNSNSNTNTRK